MRFYDMLQLDPAVIKNNISEAESKKEKRRWVASLLVRDVLIVSFAVIFISAMTVIFGEENSSMAVVIFCILLSIRFIDFGYNVRHSLFSLAVLFASGDTNGFTFHRIPDKLFLYIGDDSACL